MRFAVALQSLDSDTFRHQRGSGPDCSELRRLKLGLGCFVGGSRRRCSVADSGCCGRSAGGTVGLACDDARVVGSRCARHGCCSSPADNARFDGFESGSGGCVRSG